MKHEIILNQDISSGSPFSEQVKIDNCLVTYETQQ